MTILFKSRMQIFIQVFNIDRPNGIHSVQNIQ